MARKVILWLVSVVLAATVIFLVSWLLVAALGPPIRDPVGYWRATYCDVAGCPKGARIIVLDGQFFEREEQLCYLLQTIEVNRYDHSTYYLKDGSCEISKVSFKGVDFSESKESVKMLGYGLWTAFSFLLSIPIYKSISIGGQNEQARG